MKERTLISLKSLDREDGELICRRHDHYSRCLEIDRRKGQLLGVADARIGPMETEEFYLFGGGAVQQRLAVGGGPFVDRVESQVPLRVGEAHDGLRSRVA